MWRWLVVSGGCSCGGSDQLELVPPDTTVGEVVVVVGAAVVAVVALEPEPASDDEVEEAADDFVVPDGRPVEVEDDDVAGTATVLAAVAPGISLATRPPSTAAMRAAPPVAIPVARLTFRSAAVLKSAWSRGDIDSSFSCGWLLTSFPSHRADLAVQERSAESPL
jgi:hypothetical protein